MIQHTVTTLTKERVLELYNRGMDLEEAIAKVRNELGLTKGMADTALSLALEELSSSKSSRT